MEVEVKLPPVPAGHVRIGWSGFALLLPENWNLSLHSPARTMDRQGLLVFSDLRGPACEIRWQTPRRLKWLPADPRRALERSAAKLRHRGTVETLDGACLLRKKGMALIAGPQRLYELHCPRKPEYIEDLTRDFMAALHAMAQGPWLWSVYGIHAWLPPAARLGQIAMRAGDCRLTFQIPPSRAMTQMNADSLLIGTSGGTVTLAGFSLAHQILRHRTLRQWAGAELTHVRDFPGGTWEESGDEATWRVTSRRLGRLFAHETHLRHDPVRNRIHWTHLEQRVKNV